MGAFLVWLPALLGSPPRPGVGFAQLSFVAEVDGIDGAGPCFGNLFSTAGLPVTDFLRHVPLSTAAAVDILRYVLPSSVVGNFFLPGDYSAHTVQLRADGSLLVRGGLHPRAATTAASVRRLLARSFRRLGALLVPGSFKVGAVGGDVHYAGTLPMHRQPGPLQTDAFGQLSGMDGVHVVDGASLPPLPAKAHTLTIMANADRIGRELARRR
jgi:choline dehydrogenase-like flavoprotein